MAWLAGRKGLPSYDSWKNAKSLLLTLKEKFNQALDLPGLFSCKEEKVLSWLESAALGILQGLTEFLPISSSGHLVLGENLLKVKFDDISFEVFLHFGTFLSVVIVFRRTIWGMIKAVVGKAKTVFISGYNQTDLSENWHLFLLILLGSVPAGILGILFEEYVEKSFSSPFFVSIMLLITGFVLFLTRFSKKMEGRMKSSDALLIGIAQALAMLPGISRSGFTISTGIFRGIQREKAAEFSFLLSLPAILGATLLKLKDVLNASNPSFNWWVYLIGMVCAFLFGYLAIKFLLNVIKKGKFEFFGYYCFLIGFLSLIFFK
jgi:undecaprenyl-diphosphatase